MAQENRAAREAETQVATDAYADARAHLSTAELRELYQDATGSGVFERERERERQSDRQTDRQRQ